MQNLDKGIFIPSFDFKIITADDDIPITKKQKKPMILYKGSTFKRINESYESSFKNLDPNINKVYICSREKFQCRCYLYCSMMVMEN